MIHIRAAALEDATIIAEYQVAMAAETEGVELDAATVRMGVRAVFEDGSKGRYLVAEDGEAVIGCLFLTREWSDWRNAYVMWMHSLYIEPAYRRRGIFRRMLDEVRRIITEDPGLRGLRLYMDKTNKRAARAYEALGLTAEHYDTYEWMKT